MNLEFKSTTGQKVMTPTERRRKHYAENPEKEYWHNKARSSALKTKRYLNRPIVGWDSEGVTDPETNEHLLVMITNSAGHSLGHPSEDLHESNLSSAEIFEWLCWQSKLTKGALHVIYGGSYDFNMWLRDLDRDTMQTLYDRGEVDWEFYKIRWRQGKFFYIKDLDDPNAAGLLIYDVLPFFGTSFVNACDSIFGRGFTDREFIASQKLLRDQFSVADYKEILEYNKAEVKWLEELVRELRIRFERAGIRIKRWDGPGAIAAELLKRYNIKDARAKVPDPVAEAARYAYAGGRFEQVKWGSVDGPSYEYDLNSAYPYAMQFLPNLTVGKWIHKTNEEGLLRGPRKQTEFSLWYVELSQDNVPGTQYYSDKIPNPLFHRCKDGRIIYQGNTKGWYWASEVYAAIEFVKRYPEFHLRIFESWSFIHPTNIPKPFAFVPELYAERQRLKKLGDGAQMGIKLGLNSMYGKLAQQIGWYIEKGEIVTPPFHQLEWAGFITAMCRSTVFMACIDDLECVIAYQTDALFTTKPLPHLDTTDGLGHWEKTEFSSLTMVQSGVYFCTIDGEEVDTINKTRGFDKGTLTKEMVRRGMQYEEDVVAERTQFYRIGLALHQDWEKWCQWITKPRVLSNLILSKRMHMPLFCEICAEDYKVNPVEINIDHWHDMMIPYDDEFENYPYFVEWLNDEKVAEQKALALQFHPDSYEEGLYDEY